MKHITTLLLSITAIILSSCEKYSSEDITTPSEANSTLMLSALQTEATDDTETSWPINIYIFDKDNNIIATQLLNDASSIIDIKLFSAKSVVIVISVFGLEYLHAFSTKFIIIC